MISFVADKRNALLFWMLKFRIYALFYNEELHNLHFSPSIIGTIKSWRIQLAEHLVHTEEERDAYRILVGNPEEKRPLGRPRHR
jgi:Tfp pilus assembly protein PilN